MKSSVFESRDDSDTIEEANLCREALPALIYIYIYLFFDEKSDPENNCINP